MRAKARLLGHPIHPMLIVFPLGLLTVAAIFDIIYSSTHVKNARSGDRRSRVDVISEKFAKATALIWPALGRSGK